MTHSHVCEAAEVRLDCTGRRGGQGPTPWWHWPKETSLVGEKTSWVMRPSWGICSCHRPGPRWGGREEDTGNSTLGGPGEQPQVRQVAAATPVTRRTWPCPGALHAYRGLSCHTTMTWSSDRTPHACSRWGLGKLGCAAPPVGSGLSPFTCGSPAVCGLALGQPPVRVRLGE